MKRTVQAAEVRILAQSLLHHGTNPLTGRERRMIERIARRVKVRDLNRDFEARLTFGQRLADRIAEWGGSWSFILGFSGFLAAWAIMNTVVLAEHAFDPYPFVFLNLLLSMLASVQAPLILMSQGRQAAKDRLAAALDYEVNLRSEVEIGALHEKMDRLQARLDELLDGRTASAGRAAPEPVGADYRELEAA